MFPSRADAHLGLHIPGRAFSEAPKVLEVSAREAPNELYEVQVRFAANPRDDFFEGDGMLDQRVEVHLRGAKGVRTFHGIADRIEVEGADRNGRHIHRITVKPEAARLDRGTGREWPRWRR